MVMMMMMMMMTMMMMMIIDSCTPRTRCGAWPCTPRSGSTTVGDDGTLPNLRSSIILTIFMMMMTTMMIRTTMILLTMMMMMMVMQDEVWGVAVHPTERQYCTVGDDGTLRKWCLATRSCLGCRRIGGMGRAIAYSPDGKALAVGMGGSVGRGRQKVRKGPVHADS
jgi:WD40 repeat protein